jgi:hypothetical protein
LFVIFTKQRKALELSIKKNKKFETDADIGDRNLQESNRIATSLQKKVDQLESQKELMQSKHQRELETVNIELQEKRHTLMRFQSEVSEATDQKLTMKGRLEEYEDKIKKLIKEFEDESKRHIKEVNETHEHYRGFKTRA